MMALDLVRSLRFGPEEHGNCALVCRSAGIMSGIAESRQLSRESMQLAIAPRRILQRRTLANRHDDGFGQPVLHLAFGQEVGVRVFDLCCSELHLRTLHGNQFSARERFHDRNAANSDGELEVSSVMIVVVSILIIHHTNGVDHGLGGGVQWAESQLNVQLLDHHKFRVHQRHKR